MDYRQTSCSQAIYNKIFIGGCGQNSNKLVENIATYYNATIPTPVMKDGDTNSGGLCDCLTPFSSSARGNNWNSAFIGGQEWWLTQSLNQDMLTVQTFQTGSHVNLGKCQNQGWRGAASFRMWHGCYGWDSNDGCLQTQSIAADQTKYRTVTYDVHFDNLADFDGTEVKGNKTGARTVGANTGIVTSTVISDETKWSGQITPGTPVIVYYTNGGAGYNYDPSTGTVPFSSGGGTYIDDSDDLHCGYPSFNPAGAFGSLADYVASWNSGHSSNPLPDITDPNSYAGSASDTQFGVTSTVSATWSRTATVVSWDFTTSIPSDNPGAPLNHYSYNGTITLSDALTAQTIETDCNSLLSYWPLNNNAVMPWRTDSYTMYMPLVARREVQGEISPIGFNPYTMDDMTDPVYISGSIDHYNQIAWEDPNSFFWINVSASVASAKGDNHYNGAVLGNPFLLASSGSAISGSAPVTNGSGSVQVWGWFNFYQTDYRFCKTPDDPSCGSSPPWELYTYRKGGTLADFDVSTSGIEDGSQFINLLPQCSTHWVNNVEAHFIPKGASRGCHNGNTGIWVVKYAECRPKYPSHNFFRPCSDDRAAIDETTAQCFVDDLVMYDALPSTDLILLTFTNGYDGVYTGSSQTLRGDTHYDLTLGTKIRDLPSNYYHPFKTQFEDADIYGDYGLCGVIRFPAAWPLCGRQGVSVVTGSMGTGSIITFDTGQPNLWTNDKLSFYKSDMTLLTTSSVYRNSDTEFTSSLSGSILSSSWAQSYGSPDYHWQDTGQKLNYRWGKWNQSNRTGLVTSSSYDSCVSGSPCAESVVAFSPNGETFPNGVTSWFTGSIVADDVYGSIEQLNVEFGMIDPFYQTPKTPCSVLGLVHPKFVQDPGTCPDDGADELGNPILYFPPAPLIEAMISTPAGAPPLPSNIVWTPLVQPLLPGVIGYSFAAPTQPWETMANMSVICTGDPTCRFIKWYTC